MTSQSRPLTLYIDQTALFRRLLALLVALLIIGCATWLALAPTTVTEVEGAVVQKWTASDDGKSSLYWVEIASARGHQRCSIAPYQTQLIAEWETLAIGQQASMTCYGPTAVHLGLSP